MRSLNRLVLVTAAGLLLAVPAHATSIQFDYSVTFDPPSGWGGSPTGIDGVFQFYVPSLGLGDTATYLSCGTGQAVSVTTGSTAVPSSTPIIPGDPCFAGSIYFSFVADVLAPSPPPIEPAVFAFDALIPSPPPILPPNPIIPLGAFTTGITSLSLSGPLYGFASPGTVVGSYSVALTEVPDPVPEPASLVLVGTGFVVAARRWRRR